jgi:cytosine/adenosine deaminase-related metal-dependent hydrolase
VTELDLVLRARRVMTADGEAARCVGVADGRVATLGPFDAAPPAARTVELDDDVVLLPGLVDAHVHVNEQRPIRLGKHDCVLGLKGTHRVPAQRRFARVDVESRAEHVQVSRVSMINIHAPIGITVC